MLHWTVIWLLYAEADRVAAVLLLSLMTCSLYVHVLYAWCVSLLAAMLAAVTDTTRCPHMHIAYPCLPKLSLAQLSNCGVLAGSPTQPCSSGHAAADQ